MPWTREGSELAARTKRQCPNCDRKIRPCNMDRHRLAAHGTSAITDYTDQAYFEAMERK